MRRWTWLLAACLASIFTAASALPVEAHPLGNFTINHYTGVSVEGSELRLLYIVDYAEIPAFQEKQQAAGDKGYFDRLASRLAGGIELKVDGARQQLTTGTHSVEFLPGQGGLETLRLQIRLSTGLSAGHHSAHYRDRNFPGRLGWREIVVAASSGATISNSTVPTTSVSNQLRTYPADQLTSPLDVTEASFDFTPGAAAPGAEGPLSSGAPRFVTDRFAALIQTPLNSPFSLLLVVLAAIALGALHALEPGHGKAVMAGYLVGTSGRARDALALGVTITASHTAGVFALGLITLSASALVTPEKLYPWLNTISALAIVGIGGTLVLRRAAAFVRRQPVEHGHSHDHDHGDHHHHDHDHPQGAASPPGRLRMRSLTLLGATAGMVPCPSALVVLLAAISFNRVLLGIGLIVAFSVGLALVLISIGMALAGGGRLAGRLPALVRATSRLGRLQQAVPLVSAVIVTAVGVLLVVQSFPSLLRVI